MRRAAAIVLDMPADVPAGLPPGSAWFVGRDRELDRIGALLMGRARLVTLLGPGGIGKTALAEQAGRRLHRARRTPVFAVRLARLPRHADATAVKEAVTAAVLAEGFIGASGWEGVMLRLSPVDAGGRATPTLLILDNCEHVIAGAGVVIAELLDAVPGLTVLATSREPVGYVDEQIEAVPPLSVTQSLDLFRLRAQLAEHPITEPDQVALAEQVCRHMHGNPLCIRLAAARMFYEPLPMILKQLSGESDDMRMRWRPGPRVGSEGRHHTIGDVIAWSYELCDDKQRLLFDRLSVFAPGHDVNPQDAGKGIADVGAELDAIEVVCADDVPITGCDDPQHDDAHGTGLARNEIRDLLNRLVEQSLVSVHMTADTVRYFLLESLRLFAEDRLAQRSTPKTDEPARLARRHCYYYRDKVLYAQTHWFSPAEPELLNWAMGGWSNIRRAIDTTLQAGEPVVGLLIALGMLSLRAPFLLGSLPEICGRIEQTLAATQAAHPDLTELHVTATALIAWLLLVQGRSPHAEDLLERCVAACEPDAVRAGGWRERPEALTELPAVVDYAWGAERLWAGDPRAIAVFARTREKFHSIADYGSGAMAELLEAMAAGFYAPAEQAMSICQRHLERTTASGAGMARAWAQLMLAITLTKHGDAQDAQEALRLGRAALGYQLPTGDPWGPNWVIHVRMWSLARLLSGHLAAANTSRASLVSLASEIAYLAGGVKTQRARLGVMLENMRAACDETSNAEQIAQQVLGQQTYTDIEKRGSGLFLDPAELQQIAAGTWSINTPESAQHSTSGWQVLSAAEQEVAILAAAGWHNSAIGVRRGTSTRTTDAQISSILKKLMIDSRADIVRFMPEDQRNRVAVERSHVPGQTRGKPRPLDD